MAEARTTEIAAWCSLLGVTPDAPDAVVKAAGKALLAEVHPDRAVDEADRARREARAKDISQAVAALCDPRNAPRTRTGGAPGDASGAGHGGRPAPGGPPRGTHYDWADFTPEQTARIWQQAAAQHQAQAAARQAHERANRPARARTWVAVPVVAGLWTWGMVRWFDQRPDTRPEWWAVGLLIGAGVAVAVAASVTGLLRGTRRTAALSLLAATLAVAPATLAVTAPAVAALAVTQHRNRRPHRASGGRADWAGGFTVAGVWTVVAGLALTSPSLPLWAGLVPAGLMAVLWPLAATTLGRLPEGRRPSACTVACCGVLLAPVAAPALLVAALVVRYRYRPGAP